MAPAFTKPENALKRADELLAVGQTSAALSLLHDVISNRRNRSAPLPVLEPIMLRLVSLCVTLRRGKVAKDALYLYKNMTQNLTVATIETVMKRFLSEAEAKVLEAQASASLTEEDQVVDDLEAGETPESIMLSLAGGNLYRERTDKERVTPWLKFLWEAYRTGLDTLRNNARLESISSQAFDFCLKYARKTEFRRLSDILRQHLSTAIKYAHQPFGIDLKDPETLQRHLATRFRQLSVASALELWQEAFKTTEDIQQLLSSSTIETPKPFMMANYFESLAQTFLVGENLLYHAAAWTKYYQIAQLNKNLSAKEQEALASQVLISALSAPPSRSASSADALSPKAAAAQARLNQLLRTDKSPSREELLKEALGKNVIPKVRSEFKDLYDLLEVQFQPLLLCQKAGPLIAALSKDPVFAKYVKPIHQVILTRVLQQLSQVYTSVSLDFVVKLTAFPAPFSYDAFRIEKFILKGCRAGDFVIRINHAKRTLTFGNQPLALKRAGSDDAFLGPAPLETVRSQLVTFSSRLSLFPRVVDTVSVKDMTSDRLASIAKALGALKVEREASATRRLLIEKKRELRETETMLREREEQRIKNAKAQKEQEAERIRVEEETKKREMDRMMAHRREVEKAEAQKLAEKLALELKTKNIKVNKEELETLDTNKLLALQVQQLDKERRDLQQRVKLLVKKADHIERAYRKEEIKLLDKDYEDQQKIDQAYHAAIEKAQMEAAKNQYDKDMLVKARLKDMLGDYKAFKSTLMKKREEEFKAKRLEAERRLKEAKEARLKEFKAAKEAELARALKAEEERAQQEEEKRLAAELQAKEVEANRAKLAAFKSVAEGESIALDEKLRLQQERERMAEEKIRKQKEEALGSVGPSPNAWRPKTTGGAAGGAYKPSRVAAAVAPFSAEPYRSSRSTTATPSAAEPYRPGRTAPSSSSAAEPYRPSGTVTATPTSSTTNGQTTGKYVPKRDPTESKPPPEATGTGKFIPPHMRNK